MRQKINDFIDAILTDTSALASFEFRKLLFAQAIYETGHFSSSLWNRHNNGFGITYVNQPQATSFTTRQSDGFKFATYNSVRDSVSDRFRIANIFSRDFLNSKDIDKILNNWLINYLGYNASDADKNKYKSDLKNIYNNIDNNYPYFSNSVVTVTANNPFPFWLIILLVFLAIMFFYAKV